MSTQFPGTGKMIREKKQNPLVPMLQRGNAPGTLRVRLVERGKAIAGQNGYRLNKLIFTFLPHKHSEARNEWTETWKPIGFPV